MGQNSSELVQSTKEVQKRDGSTVPFDHSKIKQALRNAFIETGEVSDLERLTEITISKLEALPSPIQIESIQDVVERTLMGAEFYKTAKAFIKFRDQKTIERNEKQRILGKEVLDDIDKVFDINAINVLKARYLKQDSHGTVIETIKERFIAITTNTLIAEIFYTKPKNNSRNVKNKRLAIGKFEFNEWHLKTLKRLSKRWNKDSEEIIANLKQGKYDHLEEIGDSFYKLMVSKKYMPNTPTIANFGKNLGLGSACFVLDIEDTITGIMGTLSTAAEIFKYGGGVGYNFSKLRPKNASISMSNGVSSGPISFMTLFDKMTDVIKQGGIRRGANMGILNIDHPDIEEFIAAKEGNKALTNFNVSVLVMPGFMEAVKHNQDWELKNPQTGAVVKTLKARALFDTIVKSAWADAEPGLIFYDNVNEVNPLLEAKGPIVTTNPCGEVLLYPNEPCNLGSINLTKYVDENNEIDYPKLEIDIHTATRFLDDVVEVNYYPLEAIEKAALETRKIGLGVMGFSEVLTYLKVAYDSKKGLSVAEDIAEFLAFHSRTASNQLAKERGSFPLFKKSMFAKGLFPIIGNGKFKKKEWKLLRVDTKKGTRNTYTTVIAPTGSISMIAGCQPGIEPIFAIEYEKRVAIGNFEYVVESFKQAMMQMKLWSMDLYYEVLHKNGSIQNITYLPEEVRKIFKTANEIDGPSHIKMLAAWQKWTDSSVSKTINLPSDATEADVKAVYQLAYELKCKDITVFRDRSIKAQVLNSSCPECGSALHKEESCLKCSKCEWSSCEL
jgi:ribonucleoside-diphosphate reductase alpha chain